MGMSSEFYIGPMIKLNTDKLVENVRRYKGCPNEDCKRTNCNDMFCPDCGTEVTDCVAITAKVANYSSFMGETDYKYEDELCDFEGNEGILTPNFMRFGVNLKEDGDHISFSDIDQEAYLADFNDYYGKQLAEMREYFGEGSVQVFFGATTYYY